MPEYKTLRASDGLGVKRNFTTDKQMFIIELISPFTALEIQFMPEVLQWNRNAEIQKVQVVGRNNPKHHYTSGQDTLGFTLDFYSDDKDRTDVIRKIRWLKSLTMNDGRIAPIRNVKLAWGDTDLFKNEIWLVQNVNTSMSQFDSRFGMLPMQAYSEITLILDPEENRRLASARFGQSAQEIQGIERAAFFSNLLRGNNGI